MQQPITNTETMPPASATSKRKPRKRRGGRQEPRVEALRPAPLTTADVTGVCNHQDGEGAVVPLLDELEAGLGTLVDLANRTPWEGESPYVLLCAMQRKADAARSLAIAARDAAPDLSEAHDLIVEARANVDRLVGLAMRVAGKHGSENSKELVAMLTLAADIGIALGGALAQLEPEAA